MRTTILLEHEPSPAGHVIRALLKLEGEAPPASARAPLNLSLVLDRSGSMHGGKLAAARQAAAHLVRRLGAGDVVSVVAYDNDVTVVSEPSTGSAVHDVASRIARIQTGGSTNLSGGWLRGRAFVSDGLRPQGVNRVLLLTDGLANVGVTDAAQLIAMCAAAREHGVTTTTVGFGEGYDEQLLRGMAEAGGGNTYYIERPDQAGAIFNDEMEGLLTIAAQNVTVEVRVQPAVRLAAVHHEYPRSEPTPGVLRLELGDLYPLEPRLLLCEFMIEGDVASSDSLPVATLRVTADVIRENGVEHQTVELPISVSPAAGPVVDAEVRRELLLLEAARVRREAVEDEERGEYERGRRRLEQMRERMEASGIDDPAFHEEAADLASVASLYAANTVSESDRKYMRQRSYNVSSSRGRKSDLIRRTRPPESPEQH